ncbi:hypothetical protein [Paraburkholderia sp. UCT2]|uniref:hypothetical protein n=1 Tax=Paraburkholderia sp. UCT2 TaxID=2615208 RepID=UPI001654E758|nr:hypothetical protein [Paraburkholderia sp. UCT2]MBC8733367.1 hypothetical protein [Paraburkholderia sp. UCT2]
MKAGRLLVSSITGVACAKLVSAAKYSRLRHFVCYMTFRSLRFAPMKFLDDEVDISYRFCGAAHEIHRGPIHFPKLFTSQSYVKANERKGNGTFAFSGYLSR